MKRFSYSVLLTLVLSLFVNADLMYYTFDGEVDSSTSETVDVGTQVRYVFGVDFDAQGSLDYLDPATPDEILSDIIAQGAYTIDFFYSDLIYSNLMLSDLGTENLFEINYGAKVDFVDNRAYSDQSFFVGGLQNHNMSVYSDRTSLDLWSIGTILNGYEEKVLFNSGKIQNVWSTLTLVNTSNSISVPEPSIRFLFLCCIFMLSVYLGLRKSTKNNNYNT